jgi:carboxylesterase type B
MRVTIIGKGVLQGSTILDPSTKKARCHQFSRVPYALPPVGRRRWQKPQPLATHYQYGTETLPSLYTKPCSVCPQLRMSQAATSEDCLQSNVYVPLGTPPRDGWPVFFYIREYTSVFWDLY